MADWQEQRVRDWDKGLTRHEMELAKLIRGLIDYCEQAHVKAAIGEVSAARLSAAAQTPVSGMLDGVTNPIGAVIAANGTPNAAARAWRGKVLVVVEALCVDLNLLGMTRSRPDGTTSKWSEEIEDWEAMGTCHRHNGSCRSNG